MNKICLQKQLLRKHVHFYQTKQQLSPTHIKEEKKMQGYQRNEPFNDYYEIVNVGHRCWPWSPDAVVQYNSSSGRFTATQGTILQQSSNQFIIQSPTGAVYNITRYGEGGYETNSWSHWVTSTRI